MNSHTDSAVKDAPGERHAFLVMDVSDKCDVDEFKRRLNVSRTSITEYNGALIIQGSYTQKVLTQIRDKLRALTGGFINLKGDYSSLRSRKEDIWEYIDKQRGLVMSGRRGI